MNLNLTEQEVIDAVLAAAEKKAEAPAPYSIAGSAAGMAAQVEGPTATVAQIRAARAKNREAFASDPAGAALSLVPAVGTLLSAIRTLV